MAAISDAEEDPISPKHTIDDLNPHHKCSGNDDFEFASLSPRLDEDGFPSQNLLEGEDLCRVEDGADGTSVGVKQDGASSFASDFYRCGTDWSCLLYDSVSSNLGDEVSSEKRKMKQTNLFQMWGLKKEAIGVDSLPQKKMKVGSDSVSKSDCLMKKIVNLKSSLGKKKNDGAPSRGIRACPFYKKIPGTPFTVDAFRYGHIEGCSAYFLTHFHCDHYGGLSKGWSHGPIYCTSLTARLVRMCLYVNPIFLNPLELNTEYIIEGIKVTLLDANHCPGAALIHFCLPNGQCYLHTGDFRASKSMQSYPLLINQRVNVLYLDTTYCNPRYRFPSKEDVLNYVIKVTKNSLRKQPKTLVVVGAYSIGKECVYRAISKALGVKIYAHANRRRILQSFDLPCLSGSLCSQGQETFLHVLPMSHLRFERLKDYLRSYTNQYNAVLAFRPTGWTFSESIGEQLDLIKPNSRGNISIYGVPYSEHSSFTELREFVQFLRPEKIIPTVNVSNAANRDKMQSCFREWLKG